MRILDATIKDFTKAYADSAKFNKQIAQKMVFNHGLEGEVDDTFIRKVLPDTFDEAGNLTEKGKSSIKAKLTDWFNLVKKEASDEIINEYKAQHYLADSYMRNFDLDK